MKILMVDDNELLTDSLEVIFQHQGYEYKIARNGIAALKIVKEFKPDVVVLDVMMPGISGLDVCSQIKSDEALKGIYVLIVSAMDAPEDRKAAMLAGANDFCAKPYSPDEIVRKITRRGQ